MKIVIDANELCSCRINGVNSYIYNLLKALINLDDKNKFILYSKSEFREEFKLEIFRNKNFFHKIIRWPFLFWTYFRFPLALYHDKPDVLFMPIQTIPFFLPRCKIVVTVHDLAFLKFPQNFTFRDRLKLSWNTVRAVKEATKVIVPSYATKKDVVEYYKVDPEKIRVIYHGQSKAKSQKPKAKSISQNSKFRIQKPYILFVGAVQPRKNIQGLIKAFEILKSKFQKNPPIPLLQKGSDIKLVIVGSKGWLYKDIFKKARKSKYAKDIIFTGQILREELSEIYRSAEVFVLPSFYEGFGMPILEAMANGVPVIAAKNSSMIEIVGQAGILINSYKPDKIADAIVRIIQDKNLKEKLIKTGLEQVKNFSWEKCAKETMEVLTNL